MTARKRSILVHWWTHCLEREPFADYTTVRLDSWEMGSPRLGYCEGAERRRIAPIGMASYDGRLVR